MNFIKKNLLVQIILAISFGMLIGNYLPNILGVEMSTYIVRVFVTFNAFFSEFLNFFIPLIIVGLIVPAIGNIGSGASKLVIYTALIAYASTIFAGLSTFGISMNIFPRLLIDQNIENIPTQIQEIIPYFTLQVPPLLDVMSALFIAFIIGIGVSRIKNSKILDLTLEFEVIVNKVIQKIIIPLLPLFIFGIFMNMAYSGEIFIIINVFSKIIVVIFILHIALLLIQYIIAGLISKKNPFTALKTMLPAYFTALGTQSSAATIPVTLKQAEKLGLKEDIIKLTIPLCATIHLAGSTMKIVACCVALMLIQGIEIEPISFIGFVFMLGIAMVAAPGVPGGAIMAAIGIIGTMLGFDAKSQALMISLYIAMDSFGTACNVTGDGAIAMILDKIFKNKSIQ